MKKKLMAMLLCVAMLLTLVPTMAFAATGKTSDDKGATLSGSVYKKAGIAKNTAYYITAQDNSDPKKTYAMPAAPTNTATEVTVDGPDANSMAIVKTNNAATWTYGNGTSKQTLKNGSNFLKGNTFGTTTSTSENYRYWSYSGSNLKYYKKSDSDSSSGKLAFDANTKMFSIGTAAAITLYSATATTGTATVKDATFTYGDGAAHLPAVSDISDGFKVKYAAGTEGDNTAPAAAKFDTADNVQNSYTNAGTYYVWVGLFYGDTKLDETKAKVTVNPASIKGETINVYEKYDGTIQDGGEYVIVIWEEDTQNTKNQGYYALSGKTKSTTGPFSTTGLDHIKGEVIGGSTFKIDAAATLIPPVWTWNSESGTFSYVDESTTYYLSHNDKKLQVSTSSTNATWSHAAVNDSINGNHRFSYSSGSGNPYYLRHSGGSEMFQVRNMNDPETTSAVYLYTYGEKQTIAAAGVVDKTYTGVAYEPGTQETPFSVTDINGNALVNDEDYTISYYKNTGTKANPAYVVSPEAVTPKDAGSYIMRLTGKGNYNEYQDIPFDITKTPLTITANDNTIYVGDEAADNGVTGTGFVNSETVSVLTGTASYEYETTDETPVAFDKATAEAGDTYAIIPSGLSSDNYDITFDNGTLTVKSRFDLTYDDTLTAKDTYTPNTEDLIGVTTVTLNLQGGAYDSTPSGLDKVSDAQYTYTVVADTAKDITGATYRPTQTGKVFTGWDKNTTSSTATSVVFDATWENDIHGTDDPDAGDGVPDKYQKLVTFKVVNGAWDDDTTDNKTAYVTLLDNDGKWSTSGSGKLTETQIPDVGNKPNTDYKAGAWNTTPTTVTVITAATTYTYTYAQYGTISGTIYPATAKVELYKVGEHDPIGTVNDVSETLGFYSFDVSDQGSYNIVVTYSDGVVVTKLVQYAGNKVVQNIDKPSSNVNSELEVNDNTPNMVVGGLDEEAEKQAEGKNLGDKTLTVKMEVAGETDSAIGAPETKTAAATMHMDYYDIDVNQYVKQAGVTIETEAIPETSNLMTIVFPFNFTDKTNVKVMRWHDADEDGEVDNGEIEQLPEGSANANDDGEYVVLDRDNDEITMHVRFFSLYAVGYDDAGYEEPVHYASEYRVNTPETVKYGSVSASRKWASSGKTVKITVKPNKGHSVNVLTVIKQDGTPIALKDTGNGVYTFRMPAADVWVYVNFSCPRDVTCPIEPYTDTVNDSWYHDGIHYCLANGIMNGVADTAFGPNQATTRGMIVTMLARLSGANTTANGGAWYLPGMEWAVANGISDGSAMTANVTREQLATMLYNYAVMIAKVNVDKFTANTNTLSYEDVFTISEWANAGTHFCLAAGVIGGYEDGTIRPQGEATRAEVAAMFQRFCQIVLGK